MVSKAEEFKNAMKRGVNKAKEIVKSGVSSVAGDPVNNRVKAIDKMLEKLIGLEMDVNALLKLGSDDDIMEGYIKELDKHIKGLKRTATALDIAATISREDLQEVDIELLMASRLFDEAYLRFEHQKELYVIDRNLEVARDKKNMGYDGR